MRLKEFYDMAGEPDVIDRPTQAPATPVLPKANDEAKPGGARVILLHGAAPVFVEAVVHGLQRGAGKSEEDAWEIVRMVEREGRAIVGAYGSMELAETIADRIVQRANEIPNPPGFPPPGPNGWDIPCHAEPIT